jgi:hypothetical protein
VRFLPALEARGGRHRLASWRPRGRGGDSKRRRGEFARTGRVSDPAGRVASWNPGAELIKGYRAEEIWADVVITPIVDPAGELEGFVKVTRDLTERKWDEDKLRRSEQSRNSGTAIGEHDSQPVAGTGELDADGRRWRVLGRILE